MKYKKIVIVPSSEDMNINEDIKLFEAHKTNGIIIGGTYGSDKWVLYDERATFGLDFKLDDYKLDFIDEKDFISYLKSFCLYHIGDMILGSIRETLLEIKKVACSEPNETDLESFSKLNWVREFYSGLQGAEAILEVIDYYEAKQIVRGSSQRQLSSINSYLLFNDLLDRFWTDASENQKLFFFPVWMWWKITSVLPTRPIELVLTPRDCLKETDGEHYLTVRKNRIKGNTKFKTYKVDGDYEKVTYNIPKNIANEIKWYLDKTKDLPANMIDTLFVTIPHYSKWERDVPIISRYYTYTNLSTCLAYFYNEVIINKYGYTVIDDKERDYTERNEIQYIDLGDTRHIATFNAIFNGTGPVIAQMLAGHDNMEITAHYFSNIKKVVRCMAYNEYLKIISADNNYKLSTVNPFTIANMQKVEGGCCCSKNYAEGNYDDCLEARGPDFEVGYCRNCQYFRTAGQAKSDTSRFEEKIDEDVNLLLEVVKRYKNSSDVSEINRASMRFKNDVNKFIAFLIGEGFNEKDLNR